MSRTQMLAVITATALGTFGLLALLQNVNQRKTEGKTTYLQLAKIDEETTDPAEWGKNFPRQYDGYKRTVDTERTRFGGLPCWVAPSWTPATLL